MTTFERRQRLLELLRKQPGLRVPEIAAALEVSQGTVRNDLNALAEQGKLRRVHGGAALSEASQPRSPSFEARSKQHAAAKDWLARRAAELVEDGDSLLMDGSTTVYAMVRYLQHRHKLRVITNGIELARALAADPTNTVILVGGMLNTDGSSINGPTSEQFLQDIHLQKAFLSCSGFSLEAGMTEVHLYEAQLKKAAISSADAVYALIDSSKFGKVDLTPFARLEQITHLFTDDQLSEKWLAQLKNSCLTFSLCEEGTSSTFSPCSVATQHYRIGFANQSERLQFAVDVRRGLERAARQAGNVDLVLADNQLDAQTALKVAERFLTQNLDLVIEYQIDEAMGNRLMSHFQGAGLPVIAVDIPMVGATYFGVDNYRAGHMAGVAMGEWVRDHWQGFFDRLLVLQEPRAGALPASRMQGQIDGLQSILGETPAEKIFKMDCGNTSEISEARTEAALHRLPAGCRMVILCFNDDAAIGALQATQQAGREGDVVIVGMGADRQARAELQRAETRIIGSTAFLPEQYGEQLIPLAMKILRGEPVPPAVYTVHTFVTAANLQEYPAGQARS